MAMQAVSMVKSFILVKPKDSIVVRKNGLTEAVFLKMLLSGPVRHMRTHKADLRQRIQNSRFLIQERFGHTRGLAE